MAIYLTLCDKMYEHAVIETETLETIVVVVLVLSLDCVARVGAHLAGLVSSRTLSPIAISAHRVADAARPIRPMGLKTRTQHLAGCLPVALASRLAIFDTNNQNGIDGPIDNDAGQLGCVWSYGTA